MQLGECEAELQRRDENIHELTRLVERSRDQDARHAAHARDLRRQINELANQRITGSDGLTTDVQALYDRIRDLEDRIRSVHLTDLFIRPVGRGIPGIPRHC